MKFVFSNDNKIITEAVMKNNEIVPVGSAEMKEIEEEFSDFSKTMAFLKADCSPRELLASARKIDIVAKLTMYENDSDCTIHMNYLGYDKQIDSYVDENDDIRYILTDYDNVSADLFCLILGGLYGGGEMIRNLDKDSNVVKVQLITNLDQLKQINASIKKGGSGNNEQRKKQ